MGIKWSKVVMLTQELRNSQFLKVSTSINWLLNNDNSDEYQKNLFEVIEYIKILEMELDIRKYKMELKGMYL